jgi:hypothetical protein
VFLTGKWQCFKPTPKSITIGEFNIRLPKFGAYAVYNLEIFKPVGTLKNPAKHLVMEIANDIFYQFSIRQSGI